MSIYIPDSVVGIIDGVDGGESITAESCAITRTFCENGKIFMAIAISGRNLNTFTRKTEVRPTMVVYVAKAGLIIQC
jgi:hypothetical protein